MGAFSELDDLRREFGEHWRFSPFMRMKNGRYEIDHVVARQLGTKRSLKFSSCLELTQKIREIEAQPAAGPDRAAQAER